MYLKRLPLLQAQFHAYSLQTRDLKLVWESPQSVPTRIKSQKDDFFFSVGRFEDSDDSPLLVVFTMNPNRRINLFNPYGFMFVNAPLVTLQDVMVIFHTHIHEDDMGIVKIGEPEQVVRVVKGVATDNKWAKVEARKFTLQINTEIYDLFKLAADSARYAFEDRSDIDELLRSLHS